MIYGNISDLHTLSISRTLVSSYKDTNVTRNKQAAKKRKYCVSEAIGRNETKIDISCAISLKCVVLTL